MSRWRVICLSICYSHSPIKVYVSVLLKEFDAESFDICAGKEEMSRSRNRTFKNAAWDGFGGYMETKKRKLSEQFAQSDSLDESLTPVSSIFDGVTIYVNGYTDPCADELKRLMKLHGGQYVYFYSKTQVTHMITNNLPDTKTKNLSKNEKIVRPEWITDSVDAGKLLPYQDYLVYGSTSRIQPQLPFQSATSVPKSEGVENSMEIQMASVDLEQDTSEETAIGNSGGPSLYAHEKVGGEVGLSISPDSDILQEHSDLKAVQLVGPDVPEDVETCFHDEAGIDHVQDTDTKSAQTEQGGNVANVLCLPEADVSSSSSTNEHSKGKTVPKTNDSAFVKDFYSNSRLHFLSTWGAEFRDYMANLYAQRAGHQSAARRQYDPSRRTIMHVDMDCFFVSVSVRDKPWLKGKPVGVCHAQNKPQKPDRIDSNPETVSQSSNDVDKAMDMAETEARLDVEPWWKVDGVQSDKVSHAEIASCSYEARNAGVRNGMFLGRARQLCPDIQLVPYDFAKYKATSQILYDTMASYTLEIEAVSCDEAYVDVTHLVCEGQDACRLAEELRREIFDKTGCTASIGIASNILLARMATRKAKPNGQFLLTKESASDFMKDRPVSDLPGVGYSTKNKLEAANIVRCCDLQVKPLSWLQREFGPKTGRSLHQNCRGIDERPLRIVRERKSLSAEINYGIRFKQESDVNEFVGNLAKEVESRLNAACMKGKQVTLKMKVRAAHAPLEPVKYMGHGVCDNVSRSVMLASATDDSRLIASESLKLLKQMEVPVQDIRGMGIQLSKLVSTRAGPVVSRSITRSRMQRDITSFACSSSELNDNLRSRDHSQSHLSRVSSGMVSSKSRLRSRLFASSLALPPLPSFPSASDSNSKELSAGVTVSHKTLNDASSNLLDRPPPVQVEGLPQDMPEQMERGYTEGQKIQHQETASGPSTVYSRENQPNPKLPPFSEIDPEYLSALPPSIREEILSAYSLPTVKQPVTQLRRGKMHAGKLSPSKRKNKKNLKGTSVQLPAKSMISQVVGNLSVAVGVSTSAPPSQKLISKQPTLLGAIELADVRSVIREWINSSNDPEDVDVVEFQDYMDKLLDSWNLEMIFVLLKFFRRHVLAVEPWCKVYNRVLTFIQQRVKEKHGGLLDLSYI